MLSSEDPLVLFLTAEKSCHVNKHVRVGDFSNCTLFYPENKDWVLFVIAPAMFCTLCLDPCLHTPMLYLLAGLLTRDWETDFPIGVP